MSIEPQAGRSAFAPADNPKGLRNAKIEQLRSLRMIHSTKISKPR